MRVVGQLLILSFLFQDCSFFDSCTDPELVAEEVKKWVPYQQGEELYFESISGKDTLVVIQFKESMFHSSSKCTPPVESINVMITSRQAFDDTLSFSLSHRTIGIRNDPDFVFSYEDRLFDSHVNVSWGEGMYQTETTINGKIFYEVITVGCSECEYLKEVSVGKSVGVVAYKVGNVLWTRN